MRNRQEQRSNAWYVFFHPGRDASLLHLFKPKLVDARILILKLDLVSALLDAQRRTLLLTLFADHRFALLIGEGIAHIADAEGEITGWLSAQIEMLMELA